MLYVRNQDKPGVIGGLGQTLGQAGINIATFHLGRAEAGGDAICLVAVDEPVPEDVLVGGLDYIRNMVGNAPDIEDGGGQDMAYALYVLARAGRAPVGAVASESPPPEASEPQPQAKPAAIAPTGPCESACRRPRRWPVSWAAIQTDAATQ